MPDTKLTWVIEDFLADGTADRLVGAVRSQGMESHVIKYIPFDYGHEVYQKYPGESCVLFMGSINMVKSVQRKAKWVPGTWSNFRELKCSYYYAHLGRYLLNRDYMLAPFGDFRACTDIFFDRTLHSGFSRDGLFIRPDAGDKPFTGAVFQRETCASDLEQATQFMEPEDLVVISSPKVIRAEMRFIVTKGEVIAGSVYREGGKHVERCIRIDEPMGDTTQGAYDLALEIASGPFQPDPVWVVDVALDKKLDPYLLEIGGFSCAGLYACDVDRLVARVSELAQREYLDIKG